eukprot:TRINITY_DN14000_c0_g1_i7.p1 TRINITY_DN14000_c0_g1~~TRINITY_DN14000_c0_g1_i7.p1  ORF type:complete len:173 (-),score=15.82 TRINITY_DN14000_c0_g1_i7:96-614(-)
MSLGNEHFSSQYTAASSSTHRNLKQRSNGVAKEKYSEESREFGYAGKEDYGWKVQRSSYYKEHHINRNGYKPTMYFVKKPKHGDYQTNEDQVDEKVTVNKLQELKILVATQHEFKEYMTSKETKENIIADMSEEGVDEEVEHAISYYVEKAMELHDQYYPSYSTYYTFYTSP